VIETLLADLIEFYGMSERERERKREEERMREKERMRAK